MDKVLLLDDEIVVVKAIRKGINWERCGVSEVFLADNTEDAREILQQEDISLMISDIEMPGESGLDLVKELRQAGNKLPVILLTGYAEFSYAKEAVSLGVDDYVLKPVPYNQLEGKIISALEKHRKAREVENVLTIIEGNKSKPFGDIMLMLMEEEGTISSEELQELFKQSFLSIPAEDSYLIMFFEFESLPSKESWQQLVSCEKEVLEAFCKKIYDCRITDRQMLICLHLKDENEAGTIEKIRSIAMAGVDCIKDRVCCYMTDFIHLDELHECLKKIKSRSRKNVFYDTVILIGNRQLSNEKPEVSVEYTKWEILLENKSFDELYQSIEFAIHRLTIYNAMNDKTLRDVYNHYMEILYSFIGKHALDFQIVLRSEELDLLQQQAVTSVQGFLSFVRETLSAIRNFMQESQQKNEIVQMAKDYIRNHLNEKIRRDDIASEIGVNGSYLSRIFSRDTGMSISDFLLKERLKMAKRLLTETGMSVNEIAEKTGYDTTAYFIKVFHSETGMTPKKYREQGKF